MSYLEEDQAWEVNAEKSWKLVLHLNDLYQLSFAKLLSQLLKWYLFYL